MLGISFLFGKRGLPNRLVISLVIFFSTIVSTSAFADAKDLLANNRVVLISDFDRTLTGPAWNSLWVLKKIPSVNNYFQTSTVTPWGTAAFDNLPQEVPVTESEFIEIYKNKLSVSEKSGHFTVGSRDGVMLPARNLPGREKPILFIPGYYTVAADSFKFFRSSGEANYLLNDYRSAEATETKRLSRFGLTFPLFQLLTSTLQGVANIHIPTARGQTEEEFVDGLFEEWKKEGWIRNNYGEEYVSRQGAVREHIRVYPLGRGESVLFGDRLVEKKVRLVRDELLTHYRLQALQQKEKFLIILADDNPEILQEYHRFLLDYSAVSNFRDTLDFMLVHAGSDAEVARSEMPDRFTSYESGIARKSSDDLIKTFFPTGQRKKYVPVSESRRASLCKNLFSKGS
jgi:hypothetical protein